MLIQEFLCLFEDGGLLFHLKLSNKGDKQDIILRTGLISALYTFAKQVENDSIDILRMEKITLLFKKKEELIFVLFLDSAVNPNFFANEIEYLQEEFFKAFPEIIWNKDIVFDLSIFEPFKELVKKRLKSLCKRLEVITFLIDEEIIKEQMYFEEDIGTLGTIIAEKLLERNYNKFDINIEKEEEILSLVDNLLDILEGGHIERDNNNNYILNCSNCFMCTTNHRNNCFYENFLETIFSFLGFNTEILKNSCDNTIKRIHFFKL